MILKLILITHLLIILCATCIGATFLFKCDLEKLRRCIGAVILALVACDAILIHLLMWGDLT